MKIEILIEALLHILCIICLGVVLCFSIEVSYEHFQIIKAALFLGLIFCATGIIIATHESRAVFVMWLVLQLLFLLRFLAVGLGSMR